MSVADGWAQNDGFDDDDGGDPFGVSGDVFGQELGDVDPFRGNDSFDGGEVWGDFDDQGDDDEEEVASVSHPDRPRSSKPKMRSRKPSGSGGGGSGSGSGSRRSSSSTTGASSSRKPHSSSSSRRESSSSRRSNGHGNGHSSSRHSSAPDYDPSGFDVGNAPSFQADDEDPFAVGLSSGSQHGADGFATFDQGFDQPPFGDQAFSDQAFADFDTMNGGNNYNHSGEEEEESSPSRPRRRQQPPRPSSRHPTTTRHSSMELSPPNSGHSKQRLTSRRSSMGNGSGHNSMGASMHSTASSSRFRHTRRKDGTMGRTRPSEQGAKIQQSDERRSAIKDSLFGALGDEPEELTLSSFLSQKQEKVSKESRRSDTASVHSAPAVLRPPRSSRRSSQTPHHSPGAGTDKMMMRQSSHGSMSSAPSPMNGKSKRYQRKMGMAPIPNSARDTPTKQKEAVKLDIASLAQQGYLEVQDGKMRLVIDIED